MKDNARISNLLTSVATLIISMGVVSCRTTPRLPPINLSDAGWQTCHGQAVWRRQAKAAEIAGEIIVATNSAHNAMVQFIKTPFPLVNAQVTPTAWQIDFPSQNRSFRGRGTPPKRFGWLFLARAFAGQPLPSNWNFQRATEAEWRLENNATGELLAGYLAP